MCMATSWQSRLKILGARDEIGFAIDFDDHADLSAGVNVVADQAFAGLARGLLGAAAWPFLRRTSIGLRCRHWFRQARRGNR
jgi:branched-subunit amino acid ABC-type transport system permease component